MCAHRRIKRRRGFVEHQETRSQRERHALSRPSTQRDRSACDRRDWKSHLLERVDHSGPAIRGGAEPVHHQRLHHALSHCQARIE